MSRIDAITPIKPALALPVIRSLTYADVGDALANGVDDSCLSLLIRFRGQNRRGIYKLTTLSLAVETTPQRVDDIGLSGPPPDLRG